MRCELDLNRIGTLMLLLAAGAGATGCQRDQPAQPPQPPSRAPEATQPYSTSFSASGWTFHLRPLKPDAPADADKAKEVWRTLFVGMTKDAKTRSLLRHLHADLPVELVVLDAKQADDKAVLMAPPSDGSAVAMRVADISHKEEKSKTGTVPMRVIAYSHVIRIKEVGLAGSLEELAGDWKKAPSSGEPLDLAMEDYVVRHAPGWAVRGGPVLATDDKKLPSSVEEQRRELDRRIKSYADHAKAYYGALRKRQ